MPKGGKRPKTGGIRPNSGRKSLADEKAGLAFSRALLSRPAFLKNLEAKMDDGTVHPSILNTLFYYAYGKPAETVETKQIVPVRIEHVYAPPPLPNLPAAFLDDDDLKVQ